MPRLRVLRLWRLAALALLGCGSPQPGAPLHPGEPGEATTTPTVEVAAPARTAPEAATDAPPVAGGCSDDACSFPLSAEAREQLAAEIAGAQEAVHDSSFSDVHALIELSRLQLMSEADQPGGTARGDSEGQLNAMRAVAVDDASAAARLVLALALAQSFRDFREQPLAGLRLALVEQTLPTLQTTDSTVATVVTAFREDIARARRQAGDHGGVEVASLLSVRPGPLAPAPPPLRRCPRTTPETDKLCRALDDLANAADARAREQAAVAITIGWRDVRDACRDRTPVCEPHVPEAMAAASRAFASAGFVAKAIAVSRLLLVDPSPQAGALAQAVALETADHYASIGIFDQAARYLELHLELGGSEPLALERALAIRLALGQLPAAEELVALRGKRFKAEEHARWALAVGVAVGATKGAREGRAYLRERQSVFEAGGHAELARRAEDQLRDRPATQCGELLGCGVRRVLRDPTWVSATQ